MIMIRVSLDNECNWTAGGLRTTNLKCEVLYLYLIYTLEVTRRTLPSIFYPVILLVQGNLESQYPCSHVI
jgi:hypothetical protein